MSGRSDDAKEAKDIVYTGKEPFEKFDRQVNRWARRRFKGLHGHIWVGWTPMIVEMNSVQRCREIWRCLLKVSPKYATEAWKNEEEYSVERAKEWWSEAQLDLYEYLDEHTDGDANDRLAIDGVFERHKMMLELQGGRQGQRHQAQAA